MQTYPQLMVTGGSNYIKSMCKIIINLSRCRGIEIIFLSKGLICSGGCILSVGELILQIFTPSVNKISTQELTATVSAVVIVVNQK